MWPVFVFGTGRCGSTHIQRLVTLSTSCWVWGEHGGFLEPLLNAVTRYETSQGLERFVFSVSQRTEQRMVADMAAGSEMLSWVNRLDRSQLRAEVKSIIDRIFRSRVPRGWTEWGFKEIRYGLGNDTPRLLLDTFPAAIAIFTFRDPKSTIESMIRTWSPELINGPCAKQDLEESYRVCASRWRQVVRYFLEYKNERGKRIFFISSDKLTRPPEEILHTLGLRPTRALTESLGITNPGPKKSPQWAADKFDELFTLESCESLGLFTQACAQSDLDFSSHGDLRGRSVHRPTSLLSAAGAQVTLRE
jgi:hypothetical protein